MLKSIFSVVLGVVAAAVGQQSDQCSKGVHTLYSQHATSLNDAFKHPVRIMSPDRNKTLVVRTVEDYKDPDGLHVHYRVDLGGKSFAANLLGFNGEVAWSPDSSAFAVTQTEGGGSLGSRVYVFYIDASGMRKLDVSRPIERDFGHPVKCEIAIPPNTGFISWRDSRTLLVAAEVVPVSICECMGTYRVYEMRLPSLEIVRTFSQVEAQKMFWSQLGCELRSASDHRCVEGVEHHQRAIK
jgi:hypothetical protein